MKTLTMILCERCDVEVGVGINTDEALANAMTNGALVMDAFAGDKPVTVAMCDLCKGACRSLVHVTRYGEPPMLVPGVEVVHVELAPESPAVLMEEVATLLVTAICASKKPTADTSADVFAVRPEICGIAVFPPSEETAEIPSL